MLWWVGVRTWRYPALRASVTAASASRAGLLSWFSVGLRWDEGIDYICQTCAMTVSLEFHGTAKETHAEPQLGDLVAAA